MSRNSIIVPTLSLTALVIAEWKSCTVVSVPGHTSMATEFRFCPFQMIFLRFSHFYSGREVEKIFHSSSSSTFFLRTAHHAGLGNKNQMRKREKKHSGRRRRRRKEHAGIHHRRIAEKVLRNDDEKNADRAGSRPATARGKKR